MTFVRSLEQVTHSPEETFRLAEKFARRLRAGSVVALTGPIGSGKTVFTKGLSRGLGVRDENEVKSPTFVLFHLYEGRIPVQHFDLYRLEEGEALDDLGFDEFISRPEAVSVVEWADKAHGRIPPGAIWVESEILGPETRRIVIRPPQ